MPRKSHATGSNPLFDLLRSTEQRFRPEQIVKLLGQVDETRVEALATSISTYMNKNLPAAIERREGLAEYRTNPYVLMTSANVMKLEDPVQFATFLFNNKLYMGLETSFGKSIEATLVGPYPAIDNVQKWTDPPEKVAEAAALVGLTREQKARTRTQSVWREIDKSCVVGNRRYLTSIKSGPNCINDTQVQAMTTAIAEHYEEWMRKTRETYTDVTTLDLVVGITYGTERTTNNKENQILVKLLEHGFVEEDRENKPGVLIDTQTNSIRIYRRVGKDFWAFIGDPVRPSRAGGVFLEVLLALARALTHGVRSAHLETRINDKLRALSAALANMQFPRDSLPIWVRDQFSERELFWFATAISAFYDEGI